MLSNSAGQSEIVNFYENSSILITGGTGFLGRILVSKLLRSCKSLNRIYLVIRVKKGKDPLIRCKELLSDAMFSNLGEKEYLENKIKCIAGDCGFSKLGLSESDRQMLSTEITHVFHAAATVNFDETLKTAASINVQGVNEMLELCREFRKIKSIVYVSSAYAHCVRETVDELIYDVPLSGENVIYLINNLSSERIELIKNGLIAPWPNTYNFSKAIAEDVVKQKGKGLPVGIFRPSIVVGASKEPIPGWINNFYGPAGVVAGVGAGLLRILKADTKLRADLVPVDLTVNAILCAAWDIHNRFNKIRKFERFCSQDNSFTDDIWDQPNHPVIYNFGTSDKNPLTWDDYLRYSMAHGMKMPPVKAVWYISLTTTKVEAVYKMLTAFCHFLPAATIDGFLKICGKKQEALKTYRKIHKFSNVISYFTTKQWIFLQSNTERLWCSLNETDKNLFNFNMRELDWNSYFRTSISGIRKYLFKEEELTIALARKKMFLLLICHRLLQISLGAPLFWLLMKLIEK